MKNSATREQPVAPLTRAKKTFTLMDAEAVRLIYEAQSLERALRPGESILICDVLSKLIKEGHRVLYGNNKENGKSGQASNIES